MRHHQLIAAAGLAVALTGCHGPKSDCEGTMQSYAALIDGNSWDDIPDLVYPPQRTKLGDGAIRGWTAANYQGATSFEFTHLDAAVSKDVCFATTVAKWRQKIRGQNPVVFDDEAFTFTLHLINGTWYMEMPGAAKVGAY
jgi:hypothetical protein